MGVLHATCRENLRRIFSSDLILIGDVTEERRIVSPEDPEGFEATCFMISPVEFIKGKFGLQPEICTSNSSDRLMLDLRERYVIFAHSDHDGRAWISNNCGHENTRKIEDAQQVLSAVAEVISTIPKTHSGEIGGRTTLGQEYFAADSGLKDVTVTALGPAGIFQDQTDEHGEFRIIVPPGAYSVFAVSDGILLDDSENWRRRASNTIVGSGQCADLHFLLDQD